MTPRLIETWLPIAALGEESVRERRSMTALPPTYYLHVWWARRPLVASRAVVLACLLPSDADHQKYLHAIGIHGDPVASRRRIDIARRKGERFEGDAYTYPRAYSYCPSRQEQEWMAGELARIGIATPIVLDPTAGGGSIPFEAIRLGAKVHANDLNPVAALILRASIEFPLRHGLALKTRFDELAAEFVRRRDLAIESYFPAEPEAGSFATNYLWARTIRCPYCGGSVPLAPNWRLAPNGTGLRLHPDKATQVCSFEVVTKLANQSPGTVRDGEATCPFPDCGRVVDGDEVKRQAKAGEMGEQLYAVVFKRRVVKPTKRGRGRETWERGYRAPNPKDDISESLRATIDVLSEEWEAHGLVPTEAISEVSNYDRGHRMYGMTKWRDLFSPRQLLCHVASVSTLQALASEAQAAGTLDEVTRAALVFLSFSIDKLLNWNARLSSWNVNYERSRSVFDTHGFKFVWSSAEMAMLTRGVGYDWAVAQTSKCIGELLDLLRPEQVSAGSGQQALSLDPSLEPSRRSASNIRVTNLSGDSLAEVGDGTVDAIVMDPPYYDNVMYAELSDFFYVWLKRTAGVVYPEWFRRQLTDKEAEAVANQAKFRGQENPKVKAARDYQERMALIFTECRRVLRPDGILTVMFTHKATGAWDALTSGLLHAGFSITASWPVNTEFESGLNIKDKAAANSTIFLVCRPRPERPPGDTRYWEDVEPLVGEAVRKRIESFENAGIRGVDLYLSCFGPALEEFARHWPLTRGQPRPVVEGKRKAEGDALDPYAVTPEDALDAARREVKKWKLDRLLRTSRHAALDPMTEWFVLAWDAFEAPEFPYDEALRLARVVGVDLDKEIIGRLGEKKGGNLILWDSGVRAAKGALGPSDGSRSMIDALHHAAHRGRTAGLDAARDQLSMTKADQNSSFTASLTVVLEVLPISARFTNISEDAGPVADAASDFDVLEQLRRLAYSDKVREPEQIKIWTEAPGADV